MWFRSDKDLYPIVYNVKKEKVKEKMKYFKNKILSNTKYFSSFSSFIIFFIQKFHF